MTDRELMQQALEALEANSLLVNGDDEKGGLVWCMDGYYSGCFDIDPINKQTNEVITALRERLAQPEQDVPATCFGNMVPVGWLEPPDGVFRANPLYKIKFPSKLLSWQVPLYTALPQPEPVAKVELMLTGGAAGLATRIVEIDDHLRERLRPGQLLYTHPPQRKPLTDEEIKLVMDGRGEEGDDDYVKPAFDPAGISEEDLMNFARAIESAHGIKGEA